MTDPRTTPLYARHEALGATFTDFGGWSMPVRYTSDLQEHRAVREACGIFDISHMAEFMVTGAPAAHLLDYALAGRLSAMAVGKAKYSLVLAEDGGVIDDVIVYRLADDRFLIVANAGNRDAVATAFAQRARRAPVHARFVDPVAGPGTTFEWAYAPGADQARVEDVSDQFALIAVQGPRAQQVLLATTGFEADDLAGMHYYAWGRGTFEGQPVIIARTGYTGEDGFELLVAAGGAGALWDAVCAAGAAFELMPAGLAARDSLRLEAGMPLYGHELRRDIVPAQAGLDRVVATSKDDFVGKEGLAARDLSAAPVLVGLTGAGRRAPRAGYAVQDEAGAAAGEITSGALSPTLGHPIAMAYVRRELAAPGTALLVDVRGTNVPVTVTTMPFYRRTK